MCSRIVLVMQVFIGLRAILAGKGVALSRKHTLEGRRARVAGILLIAPPALSLIITIFLIPALTEAGVLPLSARDQELAAFIEFFSVLGGLVAAVIFAVATKPKEESRAEEAQESPERVSSTEKSLEDTKPNKTHQA